LSHLAVEGNVAASTQNQAFNALLFLYREVLHRPLEGIDAVRADRPVRVPVVLTLEETRQVLRAMSGVPQLVAKVLYGSGLRLMEALRLRVQDLDLEMKRVTVRDGKGAKDRFTTLAEVLVPVLREHLERVRWMHQEDLQRGGGAVYLPGALDRKYPNAAREWRWQYVFPARDLSVDPRTGSAGGIIWTRQRFTGRSRRRWRGWESSNGSAATRCGTASPRTACRAGRTSGPSRNCWGTRMFPRR